MPIMPRAPEADAPPVTDPLMVPDIFVTGVLAPEFEGGHVRVVCYANRRAPLAERVVVARVVFTLQDFRRALEEVMISARAGATLM